MPNVIIVHSVHFTIVQHRHLQLNLRGRQAVNTVNPNLMFAKSSSSTKQLITVNGKVPDIAMHMLHVH
jgi:hypothetical protein